MNTRLSKLQKNKNRPVADEVAQKQNHNYVAPDFTDNRPSAIAQRKLQELANTRSQAKKESPLPLNSGNNITQKVVQRRVAPGLAPGTHVWSLTHGQIGIIQFEDTARGSYMVEILFANAKRGVEHTYDQLDMPGGGIPAPMASAPRTAFQPGMSSGGAGTAFAFPMPVPVPQGILAGGGGYGGGYAPPPFAPMAPAPKKGSPFDFLSPPGGGNEMVGGMTKEAYLAALEESAKAAPAKPLGGPRVTTAKNQFKPRGATISRQVNGHNNDCVIAAFRTAKPGVDDSALASLMTSTEEGIAIVAKTYGMRRVDPSELPAILRQGRRAFINAPALGGGGYHAYAALGVDEETGKIIAWDTDNDHADIKLVPVELIWLAYV